MFVPPNYALALFPVSLGTYNGPERKQKQCLCKIWGDKQRVLWYFPNWPIMQGKLMEGIDNKKTKLAQYGLVHCKPSSQGQNYKWDNL